MADYIEPTQNNFDDAEQVVIDVLSTTSPNVMTKAGSVIRELVIRPLAYIFSWATANLEDTREKSSIAYLKTSQATDNPLADAVASNYFVTRKHGEVSKGIITVTLNTPTIRIPGGASFTVGDTQVRTAQQFIITNGDMTNVVPGVEYVKSVPFGNDSYVANIPVVASNPGKIEIPVGTPVTVNFANAAIVNAELTSAITGGFDTETDASLISRAEYNTAESGIGTYYGLRKKFNKAPVTVYSLFPVAGEDAPLFRARYNNVGVNPGGFVDCYVKTANQPTTDVVDFTCTKSGSVYTGTLYSDASAGFFGVSNLMTASGSIDTFSVEFLSADTGNSAEGARLSTQQKAIITFNASDVAVSGASIEVRASVTYMPNILDLQNFIDSDVERFIGQDIQVKAAIPVLTSIACGVTANHELTDSEIDVLKQTIVDCVNSTHVGCRTINFSDIRKACQQAIAGVDLRLPCTFHATTFMKDGSSDTFYSNTGILDISDVANKDYWSHEMCFFSTCLANVRLEVV